MPVSRDSLDVCPFPSQRFGNLVGCGTASAFVTAWSLSPATQRNALQREDDDQDCGTDHCHVRNIEDRPVRQLNEVHNVTAQKSWFAENPVQQVAESPAGRDRRATAHALKPRLRAVLTITMATAAANRLKMMIVPAERKMQLRDWCTKVN